MAAITQGATLDRDFASLAVRSHDIPRRGHRREHGGNVNHTSVAPFQAHRATESDFLAVWGGWFFPPPRCPYSSSANRADRFAQTKPPEGLSPRPGETCITGIPIATGRSRPRPSLRIVPGERFTTTRRSGHSRPALSRPPVGSDCARPAHPRRGG
jgi:hypothetical protein